MAKNNKGNNFTGSIGNLTYYNLKGVGPITREKYGPSKEDMDNNPNFAVTKQNNAEFGGASIVGKALRLGLGQIGKEFQDSTFSGRLAGKIRTVIQQGDGISGQRQCNLHKAPANIIDVPLKKTNIFSRIWSAPYQCTINNQGSAITIFIPKMESHHHTKPPKYAVYFKLTAALSLVSNHQVINNTYTPIHPQQNGIGNQTQTQPLKLNSTHTNTTLTLNIPEGKSLAKDLAATIWLGITYLTNDTYPMESQKAMQCIAIF